MSRTVRAAAAFAFGATVLIAGVGLKIYPAETMQRWGALRGVPSYALQLHRETPRLTTAADALLLGGLVIEGLALLGWILAPRDDR